MKRLAVLFSQKFYKSTKLESFNRQETRNKKQLQIKSCKLLSRDKSKTTNQIVICFLHNSARDKGSILLFVNASISRLIKAIHGFVWIRHVTNVGRGSCVDEYSFFFQAFGIPKFVWHQHLPSIRSIDDASDAIQFRISSRCFFQ